MAATGVPGAAAGRITLDQQPKTFGLVSMTLFAVSAMLVLDTVATSAAIGVQGLTLWVLLGIVFFIPYGFITAELGAAWPQEGGIYVWVREAFGERLATLTAFLYWIGQPFWAPSVFVLFAGTLSVVFWPSMSQTDAEIVVVALIWVIVLIGIMPVSWSKWVNNASAAAKMTVMVGIGAVGIAYAVKHGTANSFAAGQWKPSFGTNWGFLPIIIYSFMGFELMNSAGAAMKEPRRDVPKMILLSGAVLLGAYLLATFGILASLKLHDLSIVTGIADAMKLAFASVLGGFHWLYQALMVVLLFTFFGNMVTWSIGANHSMAATGLDKRAPGVFGHVNQRFRTPDYAFLLFGVVATAIAVLNYSLFASKESVFWTIFALSSIIFLLPYLVMFPAFLLLQARRPEAPRPYRVPGGRAGAWLCALLCQAGVVFAVVAFFWLVPDGTPRATYWAITGGGTLLSIVVGLWLARRGESAPVGPLAADAGTAGR
jgi:amino acid transporter